MKRQYIKSETRLSVYERDNFECQYCGRRVYQNIPQGHNLRATIDHFIPLYLGGSDSISNYVTACFECNRQKASSIWLGKLTNSKQFQQTGEGEARADIKEKKMPSFNDIYESKSKYLKVDDLQKKRVGLTITGCDVQTVGEDKKLVLSFYETEKQFVLNMTNARMLEMLTGTDDYTAWVGNRIILRPDITSFGGKPTPCIRIDSELAPASAPQPAAVVEEIPF